MGRFITKTAKDQDLYIEWSTIVDAPTAVFESTEDLRKYLIREYGAMDTVRVDRTIAHTQETGSSVMGWAVGTWDDDMLPVREGAPPHPQGHQWYLPRECQTAYAKATLAGDDIGADGYLLLVPLDDDEELED